MNEIKDKVLPGLWQEIVPSNHPTVHSTLSEKRCCFQVVQQGSSDSSHPGNNRSIVCALEASDGHRKFQWAGKVDVSFDHIPSGVGYSER